MADETSTENADHDGPEVDYDMPGLTGDLIEGRINLVKSPSRTAKPAKPSKPAAKTNYQPFHW